MAAAQIVASIIVRAAWIIVLTLVLCFIKLGETGQSVRNNGGGNVVEVLVDNTDTAFGWHAMSMTLAFPVFMTEAILAYAFKTPGTPPSTLSIVWHGSLHTFTMIFIATGLVGIGFYKDRANDQNLRPWVYSPHSWIGITVISAFGLQLWFGFYKAFVCTVCPHRLWNGCHGEKFVLEEVKQFSHSFHVYLGRAIYVGGLIAVATGLEDMQATSVYLGVLSPFTTASLVSAAAGLMLVVLGIAVFAVYEFRPVVKTA